MFCCEVWMFRSQRRALWSCRSKSVRAAASGISKWHTEVPQLQGAWRHTLS